MSVHSTCKLPNWKPDFQTPQIVIQSGVNITATYTLISVQVYNKADVMRNYLDFGNAPELLRTWQIFTNMANQATVVLIADKTWMTY